MNNIRLGIICPSEIAFRRFMPAAMKVGNLSFVGIGVASAEERFGNTCKITKQMTETLSSERIKAQTFLQEYGGILYESYEAITTAKDIDALYIPLPPALHYFWAKKALESGKHVLVEKPSTTSAYQTKELVSIAEKKVLALHENYMFVFHDQLKALDGIITGGEIGEIRLLRITFGFPRRSTFDFRYNKALGGGALFDAGGYTIKYASKLLGDSASVKFAHLNYIKDFDVDIGGCATIINESGVAAQVAFGMDNNYKCELEAWGSKGYLRTGRVLTAPPGYVPEVTISIGDKVMIRQLPEDDAFEKSIVHFQNCIFDDKLRKSNYRDIIKQSEMVECVRGFDENVKNKCNRA